MTMSRQWRAPGDSRAWLLAFGCCLSLALLCVSGAARAQEEEEPPNVFEGLEKSDAPEAEKSGAPQTGKKSDGPESIEELGGMRPEDAIRSSAELVEQANAAMRDLSRVSSDTKLAPELEALARMMPKRRAELAARIAVAKDSTRRSRRGVWVRDIRFSFAESSEQIELWQAQVNETSSALTSARRRTTEILAFWRRTRDLAREAKVAAEIRRQTEQVVEAGQRAELALARPESVIVPLQATLVEMREMTTAFLAYAEREGPNLVLDARQQDFSIGKAIRDARTLVGKADTQDIVTLKGPFADVRKTARHMLQMGRLFCATNAEELVVHGVLVFLILLGMFGLRSRAGDWQGDEPEGEAARQAVAHPVATTLLLGTIASFALYDAVPTIVTVAMYIVAMGSALRVFPHVLGPRLMRIGYVLCVFMAADASRLFLIELVPLERIVLTIELLFISLLLALTLGPRRWRASPFAERSPTLSRMVAGLWCVGAAVGALAAIVGHGSVAEILGGGVLVSMYLALILTAAFRAAGGTVWMLTQIPALQAVNVVKKHRSRIVQSLSNLLRVGAFFLWAWLSLRYLTLSHSAWNLITRTLNASLEAGSLKVSLGDFVFLALGAYLAVRVARLIRVMLDEDVLLRLHLSEGTAQVTSVTAYYGMLLFGFGCTLAAAGIKLDRLTVLAGALGVGLGFGLQNIVQNFVSGLLLLFGGGIRVRDKIQVGDLTGEVLTIGFRSSTVRTAQGAEVIVPNSKLIADQVINWTMSDRKRRVEIDISVDYDSDPEHVMQMLEEVGRSHEKVLEDPAVRAVFRAHGGDSLDFRLLAWTSYDDHDTVHSELTLALNKRLVKDKIAAPSSQSDVNLVNVDNGVVEKLRGATREPT
jgi:potassium efflux system protein